MSIRDLTPNNGRKSFYGKAKVVSTETEETLFSYNSAILKRDVRTGELKRIYADDPSNTTCCHIRAFCGLSKAEFLKLPF